MKVLFVVKNMRLANGVASYTMNYYRKLVDKNFKYDFLIVNDIGSPYYEEIEKAGGKVFCLPSYKKEPLKVIKFLIDLLKENNYNIIHCNVINSGSLILLIAKLCGIKVRILHSHATQTGDKLWKQIRNKFFYSITVKCATDYFSCSKLAGDYIFGKGNYAVIPNAVNLKRYVFSEIKRENIRNQENVTSKKVLMTVGRFTVQKNPYFIVDIVKKYSAYRDDFILWWFGNGELEEKIKKYAVKLNVSNKIRFMGACANVNEYYSAADVFILPSLYEGLPVVGIEAQIAALPAVLADTITTETKISDAVQFISIKDAGVWCNAIDKALACDRRKNIATVNYDDWDINKQAEYLKNIYKKLIESRS